MVEGTLNDTAILSENARMFHPVSLGDVNNKTQRYPSGSLPEPDVVLYYITDLYQFSPPHRLNKTVHYSRVMLISVDPENLPLLPGNDHSRDYADVAV